MYGPTPEALALRWLNRHRRRHGLAALQMDVRLSRTAAERSRDLAVSETPLAGRRARAGENWAAAPNTYHAQAQFVNDEAANRNQLDPAMRRVGIAVYPRGGGYIVVQHFA